MTYARSAKGIETMRARRNANPEKWNHGDRIRYLAGCRCEDCTEGNTAYMRELRARHRLGEVVNTLVSAHRVRQHILKLRKQGVGLRAIAAASGVPRSSLQAIDHGEKTHVRIETQRRIMLVGLAQASDSALIPAAKTWRLIANLREEGYLVKFIAHELGFVGKGLPFGKTHITVRNASRVERLHRRLTT